MIGKLIVRGSSLEMLQLEFIDKELAAEVFIQMGAAFRQFAIATLDGIKGIDHQTRESTLHGVCANTTWTQDTGYQHSNDQRYGKEPFHEGQVCKITKRKNTIQVVPGGQGSVILLKIRKT